MPKKPLPRANAKPRKQLAPRLAAISLDSLTPEQQALVEAIKSGPRGRFSNEGPFAVYLHAPDYGLLAQKLGGHLRFHTGVSPRLSEFAILCTGQFWKAQYEWHAHAAIAAKAGVKDATIRDLKAGRAPKSAPRDELAIYAFVKELYATRRVRSATYARVQKILGDAGTVELVGILGYYALISMTLNVFRMPLPEGTLLPFREPAGN
jgi:4-carboxymuconolactone decarboxylase